MDVLLGVDSIQYLTCSYCDLMTSVTQSVRLRIADGNGGVWRRKQP